MNTLTELQTILFENTGEIDTHNVDWDSLSKHPLCEEFIGAFADDVNWVYISKYQMLSEEFIRDFSYYVDWKLISKYQKLSENFVREFKHQVDWKRISKWQNVSDNFIMEFTDYIGFGFS